MSSSAATRPPEACTAFSNENSRDVPKVTTIWPRVTVHV